MKIDISLEEIQAQLIQCGTIPAETNMINVTQQVSIGVPIAMFLIGAIMIALILTEKLK